MVTFSSTSPGTYNAATDTWSGGSTSTVTGRAFQKRGNPKVYEALKLIEADALTLLFIPTTYGQLPGLGWTVVWGGLTYTVRSILPIAPDSVAIGATIVVSR